MNRSVHDIRKCKKRGLKSISAKVPKMTRKELWVECPEGADRTPEKNEIGEVMKSRCSPDVGNVMY
jgi:hypothetical protein